MYCPPNCQQELCSEGEIKLFPPLPGWHVSQRGVEPFLVIVLYPGRDYPFGLFKALQAMEPYTLLFKGPEETLEAPVVFRGVSRDKFLSQGKLSGKLYEISGQEDRGIITP